MADHDNHDSKEDNVILARLAEQAERYEDMMRYMRTLAQLGQSLSSEERNLFSVAYKNVVGARRSAWRVLVSIKQREETRANNEPKEGCNDHKKRAKQAEDYINRISVEIEEICKEVVDLVDNYLLKTVDGADDYESKTFYLKMKGDYYRYVAEVQDNESNGDNAKAAENAYSEAYEICKKSMDAAHPIRLGLALNFSVFFYEIKADEQDKACQIAKNAFKLAIEQMDEFPDEKKYKDSTLIMQLLRDNLALWSSPPDDEEEADPPMQA